MNNLSLYGWNNTLFEQKQSSQFNNFTHGRVSVVHRTCYEVISEEGSFQCELTGNMLYGKSQEEYPCTGDWVIFQPTD
ncbi:MAG: ribosome small subunit-dependent GTPase, partial [Prevotella sp.]|nr:ribosome small subunit-dependent GTPase [Prevotella sp.]